MALAVKTASSQRNTAGDGAGMNPATSTVVAPRGTRAQVFRGDGNMDAAFSVGAGHGVQFAVAEYDFAKDGALASGAVWGSGVYVPKGSVVIRSWLYTRIAVVGPSNVGATLSGAQAAAVASADYNLLPDAAVSAISVNLAGTVAPQTATTYLRTGSADREIQFDFRGTTPAATTAGSIVLFVEYVQSGSGFTTATPPVETF